jgi:hypothetical protein
MSNSGAMADGLKGPRFSRRSSNRNAWLAKIGRRGNGTGRMGDEDSAALPATLMRLGPLR